MPPYLVSIILFPLNSLFVKNIEIPNLKSTFLCSGINHSSSPRLSYKVIFIFQCRLLRFADIRLVLTCTLIRSAPSVFAPSSKSIKCSATTVSKHLIGLFFSKAVVVDHYLHEIDGFSHYIHRVRPEYRIHYFYKTISYHC